MNLSSFTVLEIIAVMTASAASNESYHTENYCLNAILDGDLTFFGTISICIHLNVLCCGFNISGRTFIMEHINYVLSYI